MAEEFGAKCLTSISSAVTHVIAAKPGTEKVKQAIRTGGIRLVYPSWLHVTAAHWTREPEEYHALPVEGGGTPQLAYPELSLFDDHSSENGSDDQEGEPSGAAGEEAVDLPLVSMDWARPWMKSTRFLMTRTMTTMRTQTPTRQPVPGESAAYLSGSFGGLTDMIWCSQPACDTRAAREARTQQRRRVARDERGDGRVAAQQAEEARVDAIRQVAAAA